jgi:hypothetical protein
MAANPGFSVDEVSKWRGTVPPRCTAILTTSFELRVLSSLMSVRCWR